MALVSNFRRVTVLVGLAILLDASCVLAEPVTHQFTGQLTTITNGSGVTLDLTGLFTLGQPVTFEYTIERDTPPIQQDPYTAAYTDAITSLSFSIGTWAGSGTPSTSTTTVSNNVPSVGRELLRAQAVTYDQFSASVLGGISTPPIGNSTLQSLTYTLDDIEGTVLGSSVIPREFPAMSEWEGKTFTVLLFDFTQLRSGYVMATLSGVTTPAKSSTWGGVKALYR